MKCMVSCIRFSDLTKFGLHRCCLYYVLHLFEILKKTIVMVEWGPKRFKFLNLTQNIRIFWDCRSCLKIPKWENLTILDGNTVFSN